MHDTNKYMYILYKKDKEKVLPEYTKIQEISEQTKLYI